MRGGGLGREEDYHKIVRMILRDMHGICAPGTIFRNINTIVLKYQLGKKLELNYPPYIIIGITTSSVNLQLLLMPGIRVGRVILQK